MKVAGIAQVAQQATLDRPALVEAIDAISPSGNSNGPERAPIVAESDRAGTPPKAALLSRAALALQHPPA